ncbi:MAG: hypothetical protein EAZ92_15550 [Candidatus Kapaibacterium sp.]|nr:MAG: hypothetical protein EAZ92_15550 [Candidatus Kapabacteria bacterium]
MRFFSLCLICLCAIFLTACPPNNPSQGGTNTGFDRKKMLEDYADKLILPNYTDLQTSVNELETAVHSFATMPSTTTLTAAQAAWDKAYTAWQHCAGFDFGPADQPLGMLSQELGTFPTASNLIETAIRQRNFTTNNFQRDTRGFPAMEYLLFSDSTLAPPAERVVMRFTSDTARASVLRAMMLDIKTKVGNVVVIWKPVAGQPSYRNGFIANDGTNVGSGTSLLFNTFAGHFEQLKNFKFGVPAGLRAGQTRAESQRVEAYWSGQSLKFAKEHLAAVENVWAGKSKAGQDFTGFEEYLNSVQGGKDLIASTKTQLTNTKNVLAAIPATTTLARSIESNASTVNAAFTELQKMTRFFKSDMSSLLGLQITFSSSDGD